MSEQPTIEGFKFCKTCGKYKPLSEFQRDNRKKDKHAGQCKECKSKYCREYYKKNHEKCKARNNAYYASHKEKWEKNSAKQYYSTDYLEKKYLKRYQVSLEKVLAKKSELENHEKWKKNPSFNMKQKMQGYEAAIEKWNAKIREAEELIALYAENKAKEEEEGKTEPTKLCPRCGKTKPLSEFGKDASRADGIQSCCKECAREKTRLCRSKAANHPLTKTEETTKKENTMTKEQLIALLADVPDHAQIIYVGDTESRSNLVATWKTDERSVCIHNLTDKMPYIVTEGTLFNLVSASMPLTDKSNFAGKEED